MRLGGSTAALIVDDDARVLTALSRSLRQWDVIAALAFVGRVTSSTGGLEPAAGGMSR